MSNIEYIVNLCFDISEQGKTPSVALIKNMSQRTLAIPEVIKGLQNWKSSASNRPLTKNKQVLTETKTEQTLQQRVTTLETQIALIMQQLANMSDKN
ncbi:hypothetical protein [Paraglaciecola arctica]|uniref:hypothetical protein n=1 Tax=Paraglaciecola arctica TaxID=1128911 RepID=UPI002090B3B5|nr:hypothetical protein [Paraglaciecola arctica]